MIIIFIILILIFILFLSSYISTLKTKKNIEGYADLSSPSGITMQITDKPSETDKLIILNELFNNVIKHETALNIYDPTYKVKPIMIDDINHINDDFPIFSNCMKLIPFIQYQENEITKLTKAGYIQSKTLKQLVDLSGCEISLDGLRRCGKILESDPMIEKIYEKYKMMLQSFYKVYLDRDNRNLDEYRYYEQWKNGRWDKTAPFPRKYLAEFDYIANKYKSVSFDNIILDMYEKMKPYNTVSQNMSADDLSEKYLDIKKRFIYARRKERFPNISNPKDFLNFQFTKMNPIIENKEFPKEYILELTEIFVTNYNISAQEKIGQKTIDDMASEKIKYANNLKNADKNSIQQLAQDLYRMINNTTYSLQNQIPEMRRIQNSEPHVLSNGVIIQNWDKITDEKITDNIHDMQAELVKNNTAHNPPLTERQALSKIEFVILFYIVEIVKYQDLEIKNISKNALNTFKEIYSIYT